MTAATSLGDECYGCRGPCEGGAEWFGRLFPKAPHTLGGSMVRVIKERWITRCFRRICSQSSTLNVLRNSSKTPRPSQSYLAARP